MFNIALLGAGRIGQVHAANIASHGATTLWSVVDPNQEFATRLATQYQARQQSLIEAMTDPNVHAVLIASATDTHADLIETFARAGKHVFCEKPVDLDIDRARQVVAIANDAGIKLMLGFNRRFDPNFAAARRAIDQGRIGAVEMVTITSRDPGAPDIGYAARSGGIFRDMTIHDLDMARFLLGEEPVAVSAHASVLVEPALREIGDHDSVTVILETASGKQAVITNSRRASYGYDQRIEVHGALGVASVGNHLENQLSIGLADGYHTAPLMNFFMTRYTASYAAEIAEFVACIAEGRAPSVTGADGVAALRLANACVESVARKARVAV